jgi:hypothetical protein
MCYARSIATPLMAGWLLLHASPTAYRVSSTLRPSVLIGHFYIFALLWFLDGYISQGYRASQQLYALHTAAHREVTFLIAASMLSHNSISSRIRLPNTFHLHLVVSINHDKNSSMDELCVASAGTMLAFMSPCQLPFVFPSLYYA